MVHAKSRLGDAAEEVAMVLVEGPGTIFQEQVTKAAHSAEGCAEVVSNGKGKELEFGEGFLELGSALMDALFEFGVSAGEVIASLTEGVFVLGALDNIGGLAGEEVEQFEGMFARLMGSTEVGGEHSEELAGPAEDRRRLNGANTGASLDFQGSVAGEDGALFNIRNEDAFSACKSSATGTTAGGDIVPEIEVPLGEAALSGDAKARTGVEELDGAEVGFGDGDGSVDNLLENRLEAAFADEESAQVVEPGGGFQVAGEAGFGELAVGDVVEDTDKPGRARRTGGIIEHDEAASGDPAEGAIGPEDAEFGGADFADGGVEGTGDGGENALAVFGVDGAAGDIVGRG
jgi:hypothetical protein